MRGDVGPQIDGGEQGALFEVEHTKPMLRIGIAAVDAVAEDRHVRHPGLRHDQQLVHGAREAVDHHLGLVSRRVEK